MNKSTLSIATSSVMSLSAQAAVLASWDFPSGNLTATTTASGFTEPVLTREVGTSSNPTEFLVNRADTLGWSGRSFTTDESQWFEFTVTPGVTVPTWTPTSITFDNRSIHGLPGGTVQANFTVFSSADSFAASIVSVDGTLATTSARDVSAPVILDISTLGTQTGNLTLRVVMKNIGGTNGVFGQREGTMDNLVLNGTLSPIPEPSTAILGGLGLLALLRRRR